MKLLEPPRQPFVGVTLAAAAGIFLSDYVPSSHRTLLPAVLAALALGAFLLVRARVLAIYGFVGICFFLLHAIRTTDSEGSRLAGILGAQPQAVELRGSIVTEPKIAPNGFATFLVKLSAIDLQNQTFKSGATVFVRWRGHVAFADEVALFGVAQPVPGPRNPGEFDMRSFLMRRDVRHAVFVRYPEEGHVVTHHTGNPILRAAQWSRDWLQTTICRGLDDAPDVQNFLSGIVLGLRHQTPEDIEEPFQQTGTLHLFAVAGLHVAIVAQLLWILARSVQLPRRYAAAVMIPSLFFYAAITGLHVSSLRAAIMSSALLGSYLFERRALRFNSLAAAAFILFCWDTNELFASGFQLSFAVVATIIALADPLSHLIRTWSAPDPFLPPVLLSTARKVWHGGVARIGQAGAVSLAAWAGSLVLIATYFYLVTPISLLANLVVVPLAFFIIAIALLSVVTAPFATSISVLFNNANFLLARVVLATVHFFAGLPGGHYYVEHLSCPDGVRSRVDVLDVGAGGAVRAVAGGHSWLFDCGAVRDYDRTLRPYLHAAGVNRIDGLVLSHGDSQHIGGALLLLNDLVPERLVDNPAPDRSKIHEQVRRLAREIKVNYVTTRADDTIHIGDAVTGKILHPRPDFTASVADDQALVVQLSLCSGRLLLMGDNGATTERALLASDCDLHADIIVKGQNVTGVSGTDEFLDAVRPRLIVTTSRSFPSYERVSDEWAERVRKRGIRLFRQDETGAVQFRFRDDGWEAKAYVTGETFRSDNR
jgi:competence protein ComEC